MKKQSLFPKEQKIKLKFTRLFTTVFILFFLFTSCKKKNDAPPPNNNELKATVIISPGNTININATGSKVRMGCGILGGGTFIEGVGEDNAAIYISYVFGNGSTSACVTAPGTYNFSCEYRKNISAQNTPIFSNNGLNRGSITVTVVNDHHMEGYFNAVSWCNSPGCAFGIDSVIIAGTFKGDF